MLATVRPIPVSFHVGPLVLHTYGIGLAITFLFGYWYFKRRLQAHGWRTEWTTSVFVWVVVAATIGARAVHVISEWSYYSADPALIPQIWKGGLSSYGGIIGGFLVAVPLARRRCPELPLSVAVDLAAPVLMASWALGRLLGPQLMVAGGGPPTHAWYGMYYAGQEGKRVPVPIFQAIECGLIWLASMRLERLFEKGPAGMVFLATGILWNVARFFDQFLWLDYPKRLWDPVEVGALATIAVFSVVAYVLERRWVSAGRPAPMRWGRPDATRQDAEGLSSPQGVGASAS
jgi:phosphatidylglycerol:prolipoprotein diacylglycerol transferase